MLEHKQYQLLICKLKSNDEKLYVKSSKNEREMIIKIENLEIFKEIYSLFLLNGYFDNIQNSLFEKSLGIRSIQVFEIHLKYEENKIIEYIFKSMDKILKYNNLKLIEKVLEIYKEYSNNNEPFTLTSIEKRNLIISYLNNYFENNNIENDQIEDKIKLINNIIPTSSESILNSSSTSSSSSSSLELELLIEDYDTISINKFFQYTKLQPSLKLTLLEYCKINFKCYNFNRYVEYFDEAIFQGIYHNSQFELQKISTSIESVLIYFKLYYCNSNIDSPFNGIIPEYIQSQIDIIIIINEDIVTLQDKIKLLFQLLVTETQSFFYYACFLFEYNEPVETIDIDEKFKNLLLYFLTKTFSINLLKFLIKRGEEINYFNKEIRDDLNYNLYFKQLGFLFLKLSDIFKKPNEYDEKSSENIINFIDIYTSQNIIFIETINQQLILEIFSMKSSSLYSQALNSISPNYNHHIPKDYFPNDWNLITSSLFDKYSLGVSIKDKETIDWLADSENGGCSTAYVRNCINLNLNKSKLYILSKRLLEYARLKFEKSMSLLDSNLEICNIHLFRTHDNIISLINKLIDSNFNNNKDLYQYFIVQWIQYGSSKEMEYQEMYSKEQELNIDFNENYQIIKKYIYNLYNNNNNNNFNYKSSDSYHLYNHSFLYKVHKNCSQIINLSNIKINLNKFEKESQYLFQTFIELLNFDAIQFFLDNLIGIQEFNDSLFKDNNINEIYNSKYLYKDLIEMIEFLIDKYNNKLLLLSNLSLILNYLFLKLIRIDNLTRNQLVSAYELISNYIIIEKIKIHSYYYLKTLSPIITDFITTYHKESKPICIYNIDPNVYSLDYIFTNRNNTNELDEFIESTITNITNDDQGFIFESLPNLLSSDVYSPKINLFLNQFKIYLEKRKSSDLINNEFLDYKLLKIIIRTFDLESFIQLDNLVQEYYGDGDYNSSNKNEEYFIKRIKNKSNSSNMVDWFGIIIYKDFSDYQDIITYLFDKYSNHLKNYTNAIKKVRPEN